MAPTQVADSAEFPGRVPADTLQSVADELNSSLGRQLLESILQPFLADFWGTLESAVTIGAILVGGFWTYWLFVRRRLGRPRLNTSITAMAAPGPPQQLLLQIRVELENVGNVLVPLGPMQLWVQQVSPIPDELSEALAGFDPHADQGEREFQWPALVTRETRFRPGEAEIEPGETDVFTYDVLVPDYVAEVQVYVYAKNLAKDREIGWSQTIRFRISPNLAGPEPLVPIGPGGTEMAKDRTSKAPKEGKQQPPKPSPEKLHEQQTPKETPPSNRPGGSALSDRKKKATQPKEERQQAPKPAPTLVTGQQEPKARPPAAKLKPQKESGGKKES